MLTTEKEYIRATVSIRVVEPKSDREYGLSQAQQNGAGDCAGFGNLSIRGECTGNLCRAAPAPRSAQCRLRSSWLQFLWRLSACAEQDTTGNNLPPSLMRWTPGG